MHIQNIWMSQKSLRRKEQIPEMIRVIEEGGNLPPIIIAECEDGEFQLEDGHHRLTAYWLSGRTNLERGEFVLVQKDQWRTRHGKGPVRICELEALAPPSLRTRLSSRTQ